jgi:transposase InsO family protein
VKPETILGWHRKLVAKKFDGSKNCSYPGRPKVEAELEALVVRLAKENRSWGYDRIVGALCNLGYTLSDQTVGNILKRNGIYPAPERRKTTTWKEFIRSHMDLLVATDFFSTEVWTPFGLVTYYALFFIRIRTREVHVAGITPHPDQSWMTQIARNITMIDWGFLTCGAYLIHDRDGKYCAAFQSILEGVGIKRVTLPARSPNLNAFAERWVQSIKQECLSKFIFFGEDSLRRAIHQYVEHYHRERNHQGIGNELLIPARAGSHLQNRPIR